LLNLNKFFTKKQKRLVYYRQVVFIIIGVKKQTICKVLTQNTKSGKIEALYKNAGNR